MAYRRWGIAPRPEDVLHVVLTTGRLYACPRGGIEYAYCSCGLRKTGDWPGAPFRRMARARAAWPSWPLSCPSSRLLSRPSSWSSVWPPSRPSWRANARSTAAVTSAVLNFLSNPIFISKKCLNALRDWRRASSNGRLVVEYLRSTPPARPVDDGINHRSGCRPLRGLHAYSDNRSRRRVD